MTERRLGSRNQQPYELRGRRLHSPQAGPNLRRLQGRRELTDVDSRAWATTREVLIQSAACAIRALAGAGPHIDLAAGDCAVDLGIVIVAGDLDPARRTIAVQQRPLLALTIVVEYADAILSAIGARPDV